jgi:organic hydroperoxide reductase OsmC/OhrA
VTPVIDRGGRPDDPERMNTLVRAKSFTYHTTTEWAGGKAGMLGASGKPSFRVASPPEFRGEPNVWTPEDLLVAAVETCLLMTFTSIAQRRELPVEAYYSEASGLLEQVDGKYRFTRVVVKPTIIVKQVESTEAVLAAIRDAHRDCLIANSLSGEILVEPDIRTV